MNNPHLLKLKRQMARGSDPVRVVGLSGAALPYFFSLYLAELERPCLVLTPGKKEADRLYKELQFFMSRGENGSMGGYERLYEFPAYDMSPLTGLSPHRDVVARRLEALHALLTEKNPVVIASLEALFFKVLPKDAFVNSLEFLEAGEELDRDDLIGKLEARGYQRASLVEERGDYSVRGGVIDVFSPIYPLPLRLEFWGDRIESIREFDPLSQRSQNHLKEAVLPPGNEVLMEAENLKRARSMGRLPRHSEEGSAFPGQEAWLNHFYPRLDALLDYLPKEGLLTTLDAHRTESVFKSVKERFKRDVERFRQEAAEKKEPFPETDGLLASLPETTERAGRFQRLEFGELDLGGAVPSEEVVSVSEHLDLDMDFEIRLAQKGRVSLAPLAERISQWLAARASVVLVSRTEQQANRIREILENYEVGVDRIVRGWGEAPDGPGLSICLGRLTKGFAWPEIGLYVISEDEIFGQKRGARALSKRKGGLGTAPWSGFSQLKEGDLVVHEDHGVGRYGGLRKLEVARKVNDFAIVEYANGDRLYIPADRLSVVQKYVGADDAHPKLDQLGGRSWDLAKEKAKKSVRRIAKQLIELYALRKYRKGFAFSPADNYFREFEATFEHEETPDQTKVIEEVLEDMASEQPMDRLICGDVGFGKTEVAVRAAFKAVSDGKQVALLVPTTVLAEQHHEEFKKRMASYPVRVGILSRFKTRAEQAEVVAKTRSGKIDILIGTHRILQKDVEFKELGLLIVDEEQRFGVKQKEALKKYRALVDVLAITATPIPRTLQMSMMGVRDLSVIETPPQDRQDIETYLTPYEEGVIIRAVKAELERGGQVFFVHNRVRTIDFLADQLRQLVPEARFAVAHGQMKERDLEKTMMRFLQKNIDVLVCTTIIESGLDIPSANTIIINEADRLGLAQIYQLRGRVGRSKEKAYAYLLLSNGADMTKDAEKRLKALMDFSHLGAGLHLAMHDLKIRGGGNILGFSQAGHISAVGYELYLKLIERAIAELKGEDWHEEINPEINMDVPAFLPGDYVADADVRLNLYRRLSGLRDKADLPSLIEEIRDRFGPPPKEAENLFGLMSLRLIMKGTGISRLDVGRNHLVLTFASDHRIDPSGLLKTLNRQKRKFQFLSENKLKLSLGAAAQEEIQEVEAILDSLTPLTSPSPQREAPAVLRASQADPRRKVVV